MKLLLLGGTKFLGRHIVEVALQRGHEVTLFHRGQTNPQLFPEVEKVYGDREKDLSALQGRQWDAVIDTSGYVPRIVQASATFLADKVKHYTFISTVSVYDEQAAFETHPIDEQYPVGKLADETVEEVDGTTYGPLKALCEQAVLNTMPGRALVIRPGLIVGPHDPSDRFTYWPRRIAQGGEVLAPDNKELPVQIIDVRDLAAWSIRMAENAQTGVYHATGPDYALNLQDVLEQCRTAIGSDASFTWVSEAFLAEQKVEEWTELPLWVPRQLGTGHAMADLRKAIQAGLTFRPLEQTIKDTLTWAITEPDVSSRSRSLRPAREAELLQLWHAHAHH